MARRVFVSFRFSDGSPYKEKLDELFGSSVEVINRSEDTDRSNMSEDTIRNYLYEKLSDTSVTIILLTPNALDYERDFYGRIDDWTYDEVRYSLEDRTGNRTNGLVAVYVPEAENILLSRHDCTKCGKGCEITSIPMREHLFRKNMMNVKSAFASHTCFEKGIFDADKDSYCSLVSWNNFIEDYCGYIDRAADKRNRRDEFKIVKHLQ